MTSTLETIGIIFVSCTVSAVVSVALAEFLRTKKPYGWLEYVGHLFSAMILTAVALGVILGVGAILFLIFWPLLI